MKRIFLLFTLVLFFIPSWADEPMLSVVQAFDGRYRNEKGVSISLSRIPGNYYYYIYVNGNSGISKQLQKWVEQDEKKAETVMESTTDEIRTLLMVVEPGDVSIGVSYTKGNTFPISLWMHSSQPIPGMK